MTGLRAPDPPPGAVLEDEAPLVHARQLSKLFSLRQGIFGKKCLVRAVEDASLGILAGETVGLVGESSSGKSTLGRLLLRLIEPSHGRVWFDGEDITHLHARDLRPLRRHMQILFQDAPAALDGWLDVAEIIAEPLRIHGACKNASEEREHVLGLLDKVGLSPRFASRRPAELSSGQCQRVSIARALALGPRFIVCDEPMAALDPAEQAQIVELLGSLQQKHRHSYLFISHDVRQVLSISRRVYVMYAGRIVESANQETLRHHARHPYTRALMNAIPEVDPKRRRLRLLLDGEPPSPFRPIDGCAFHPRCPRALPGLCERESPPLVATGPEAGHDLACWHPHT
jgi:oligopeptide/dipeptide ABC transporter ATP-binding protein